MSYLVADLISPIPSFLGKNECLIFAIHHIKECYLMFSCILKDGSVYSKVPFNRFGTGMIVPEEAQPWTAEDSNFEIIHHPILNDGDGEGLKYLFSIHQERVSGGSLGVNTLHLFMNQLKDFCVYPNHYCRFHHGRWNDPDALIDSIGTIVY